MVSPARLGGGRSAGDAPLHPISAPNHSATARAGLMRPSIAPSRPGSSPAGDAQKCLRRPQMILIVRRMNADARFADLDLQLPPAPKPMGVYRPMVTVGNLAYLSGHGPL